MALFYAADTSRACMLLEPNTYGTTSGAGVWIGRVQDLTPTEDEGTYEERFVGGGTRNISNFVLGPTTRTLKMTVLPQDFRLLAYAFGNASVSGTYGHSITELNTTGTFPSFSIEEAKAGTANLKRTYAGCILDTLTVTANEGEEVKFECDVIAQSVAYSTAAITAVTSGTKIPYLWSDCKGLEVSGTSLGLDGFLNETKNFSFKLENSSQVNHYVAESRNIGKPIPANRAYTAEATVNMTEATGAKLWINHISGTEFNAAFWITRAGSASTSGADFIQIWMTGCTMKEASHPNPIDGVVEQKLVIRPRTCGASGCNTIATMLL